MSVTTPPSIYRDSRRSAAERAADLLAQMSLDEKLAQLGSAWSYELLEGSAFSEAKAASRLAHGLGQVSRLGGSSLLPPVASAEMANTLQRYLQAHTRLGIPAIIHEECCAGYMARGGSVFPEMLGLASTWQPELAEQMTTEIRAQMRAVGAHQGLAPVLDVARDPRWGRVEETFGEDPTLVAHFGVAYIRGLQGADFRTGILGTGKHFAGHSFSQGGLNCGPVQLGWRDLWEVVLLPFQAAIREAGLASMMNAYPEVDGTVVAASRAILTDLLRGQLGFDGLVVSDYEAVQMINNYHRMAEDFSQAAELALTAGIDVELPSTLCYGAPLRQALEAGRLPMATVDTAVQRLLVKKFELGLFENPFVDPGRVAEVFDTPAQRALARQVARQSLVLLKNAGGALPLAKTVPTLAVIGPNANEGRHLLGDYSYPATVELLAHFPPPGSVFTAAGLPELAFAALEVTTVLEAIRGAVSPATQVLYAQGCGVNDADESGLAEAVRLAQAAEATVLVLGDKSGLAPDCTTGEFRDGATLALPGRQQALAEAVLAVARPLGKPVIVVLINGRPLALPWLAEQASAIVEAWLPGEEGAAAIADLLFGDAAPGGKLPLSIPRSVGQLPVHYNHKPSGRRSNIYGPYVDQAISPLYPFGHGLSYTTFGYADLSIAKPQAAAGETVAISFRVTNTGRVAGDEVVQLYICDEYACVPRPVKELKGYQRLTLAPGQSQRVTFQLPVNQLAFYDADLALRLEPGRISVMVGSSSEDIRLTGEFAIAGAGATILGERVYRCPVDVSN